MRTKAMRNGQLPWMTVVSFVGGFFLQRRSVSSRHFWNPFSPASYSLLCSRTYILIIFTLSMFFYFVQYILMKCRTT